MYNVLFICTANICRTPIAVSILQKLINDDGLQDRIVVESAGTWAVPGQCAAPFSEQVILENGYPFVDHESRPIDLSTMNRADLVLCMSIEHGYDLTNIFPHFRDKIFTLREFQQNNLKGSRSVLDPFGMKVEKYRETFELIRSEVERIWPTIKSRSQLQKVS